jgi:hypothetical protein
MTTPCNQWLRAMNRPLIAKASVPANAHRASVTPIALPCSPGAGRPATALAATARITAKPNGRSVSRCRWSRCPARERASATRALSLPELASMSNMLDSSLTLTAPRR